MADRLALAIAYSERSHTKTALLFLDLDQFKTVNDSLGHPIGDALLQAAAQRLRQSLRDTDSISRQGGDEFLVVLPEVVDTDVIADVARKILTQLSQPLVLNGRELSTSVSIGVAVYPEDGDDFDTLLKKADIAMYHAKEAGRNTCRFYTEQMNIDADEHLHIRNSLQRALERGEFTLHYQPQVDLHSGAVVGVEALVRWRHPELGMLPPDRFIAIAEDCGLIVPLGEWVLHEACRQAAQWRKEGWPLLMAVNMSGVQFKRGDLERTVSAALAGSGLDSRYLELELTESMLLDAENVLATVQRLKALGVRFAIDDFGTGYSSLAYLKRFDVDKLKIDRSFMRDVLEDAGNTAIVSAIIQIARSLNLKTVAEGVEDERVLAYLRSQHCDEAQGYYFARPMPAAELSAYLAQAELRPHG
jgi:diguanylate cyclase (GGDEF)-like protein